MSKHTIIATPEQEAHLRGVLDTWRTERGLSRTKLSCLLVGTDFLLPFWRGQSQSRMTQTTMSRILIGCRAAGIEATQESLLGPAREEPTVAWPRHGAQTPNAPLALDSQRFEELVARVERLEVIYSALMFQRRLESIEDEFRGLNSRFASIEQMVHKLMEVLHPLNLRLQKLEEDR